jgi:hypothetical protein
MVIQMLAVTVPLCTCRQDVTACFPRGFPAGALTQSVQFTFAVGGPEGFAFSTDESGNLHHEENDPVRSNKIG